MNFVYVHAHLLCMQYTVYTITLGWAGVCLEGLKKDAEMLTLILDLWIWIRISVTGHWSLIIFGLWTGPLDVMPYLRPKILTPKVPGLPCSMARMAGQEDHAHQQIQETTCQHSSNVGTGSASASGSASSGAPWVHG